MNNELDDWLEWTDARGASLEDLGFREWLSELIRKEREEAWDEAEKSIHSWYKTYTETLYCSPENPYRKEQP